MKKYLFTLFTALALVLAVAFAPALVKAASNQSPTQNLTPKVEEVKINGEAVEPIITSVSEVESSTTTQAKALKDAKKELDDAFKETKNDKGETVKYIDYSKVDSGLKKKLDDVAKTINKDYNSSVFQVSSLFEFSLPEGKTASKENPVTATFDTGTSEKVTVIHKVGDNWEVVSAEDTQQSGNKVTVKFTSLCPVAFLTANPNTLVPAQADLTWLIFVAIGVVLLIILLVVLLRKPKDKVVSEDENNEPQEEETPADEEAKEDEEQPVEEETQEEETQEETQEEEAPAEEESQEETTEETPAEEEQPTEEEQTEEETQEEEQPQEEEPTEEQPQEEEAPAEEEQPQEEETQEEAAAPAEEEPAAEETQEETPAEETSAEETPAEETSAEETPTEETPTEEEAAPEADADGGVAPVVVPVAAGDDDEKKPLPGKYEVYPVGNEGFYIYRLKASNGEIMVISELYKSAQGASDAINTVIKNIEIGTYDIYQDKHNMWQFKLYSSNKRLLVASANYRTKARCEAACESFKRFAPISPVVKLEEDVNHLMEEIDINPGEDKKGGKIIVDKDNGENEAEFRLLANNGTLLCSSMSYKTRSILMEQANNFYDVVTDGKFYVVKDKNKMFQFKLYSSSGRCILIGETYGSKTNAISAANSVARFAKLAEVIIEE